MPSSLLVGPSAFVVEADVESYVLKALTPSSAQMDTVVRGINWGAATMEQMTGRKLRARNYTFPRVAAVTVSGSTLTASAADVASVRVGDPVVATGFTIPAYVTVTAINGGTITMSAASTAGTSGTATFGSRPMIFDGDASRMLGLYETPLKSLFAAWCTYGLNLTNPLDITSASIEYEIGRVTLRNDFFYSGVANVQVECRAGYEQPSGSTLGDPADWDALSSINLRLAQVYWQEWMTPSGRFESGGAGGATATRAKAALPADLTQSIMAYARRGC